MIEGKTKTWDAIVIGSGMGGMTSAAALAKTGHKVLLLEQYKTLGGLTHSFSREGFSWDVGIHYLGCVAPGDRERGMIDWLTHTPMEFEPMGRSTTICILRTLHHLRCRAPLRPRSAI